MNALASRRRLDAGSKIRYSDRDVSFGSYKFGSKGAPFKIRRSRYAAQQRLQQMAFVHFTAFTKFRAAVLAARIREHFCRLW
jgi:hypothetical protein